MIEALAAAKRNGLRFGPEQREKLLAFLPLKALSAVYGPLQIKKAKLRITTEHEKDAKFDFAIFNWELTANEIGTRRRLYISVDPSMEEYGAFRNETSMPEGRSLRAFCSAGGAISFRPSSPEGAPSRLLLAKWDSLSIFACTPAHCLAVHSVSTSTTPGMPRA